MADAQTQTCETEVTLVPFNIAFWNDVQCILKKFAVFIKEIL
jgi:hypothetical protein